MRRRAFVRPPASAENPARVEAGLPGFILARRKIAVTLAE